MVEALVSEAEALVVDAELVEQGGVEVVHVDRVPDNVVAHFISFAVGCAGLDAAAGSPEAEAARVVVAAVVGFCQGALGIDGASKLTAEHDEGIVQHAALFEVLDETVAALVHVMALLGEIVREIAMLIPAAMEDLHKPDATLHEAAGHEGAVGKGAAVPRIGTIEVEGFFGLGAEIRQVRHTGLHTECHLVLLGAGLDFGVAYQFVGGLIQGGKPVQHFTPQMPGNARGVFQIQHGISFCPQGNAGMFARQEACAPEPGGDGLHVGTRIGMGGMKNHEGRQVLVHGAQTP